jgi:hypothetical protein
MRDTRLFRPWPPSTKSALLTTPYRQAHPEAARPRLARLREGVDALVLVARTVWQDAGLRRVYLRVALAQLAAIVVFGTLAAGAVGDDDDEGQEATVSIDDGTPAGGENVETAEGGEHTVVIDRGRIDVKDGQHTVLIGSDGIDINDGKHAIVLGPKGFQVRAAGSSPGAAPGASVPDGASPGAAAPAEGKAKAPAGHVSAKPPAARHVASAPHRDDDDDDAAEDAGEDEDEDDEAAKPAPHRGPRVIVHGKVIGERAERPRAHAARHRGLAARLRTIEGKIVTIYGIFVAVAWCVVALSRDYHDAIGREASLRLGLPPEDPPIVPRVRLNMPWVKTRLKRRVRGFMLFTLGVPPLWVLSFFIVLPLMGVNVLWSAFDTSSAVSRLYGLLAALWGAYWLVVFTGAKTALAWADERVAPEPWFLRVWGALTSRLPGAIAWLPRGYGQAWHRMSRQVFAPAICFERAPYELAGLAAIRLLGSVPLFYPFVRPLTPVAAALLVARHAPPTSQTPASAAPPAPPA